MLVRACRFKSGLPHHIFRTPVAGWVTGVSFSEPGACDVNRNRCSPSRRMYEERKLPLVKHPRRNVCR